MLIIVAILGILAALSVGAYHVLIPRWRLQDAGNQLDSIIKRARLIAIQRQTPVEIRFEDDAGAAVPLTSMTRGEIYTLVARDASEDVAWATLYALGSGIEVDAITFAGEVIRFDELGRSASTGGVTFGYDYGNGRRLLSVSIDAMSGVTSIRESDI